jgi:hypothetical protein
MPPNYQTVAFWPPLLVKTVKLDEKYKTMSFFGVKLLKCPFEKKNQFKKYPQKRHRFEKKKKKKKKKRRRRTVGYVISPKSPASSRTALPRDKSATDSLKAKHNLAEPNSSPSLFASSLLLSFFLPRPLSNSRPLSVLTIWL